MSLPPGSQSSTVIHRVRQGERQALQDRLAVEEPLEIRLGYTDKARGRVHKSVSITMRTPGHDAELALGFLFSEGIVQDAGQIEGIDERRDNVVGVELKAGLALDLSRLDRHFYTTSSCGICGKASLEALGMQGAQALDNRFRVPAALLQGLPNKLRELQPLFSATGGNHGTALFDPDGNLVLAREDVGRHNALDKLVGRLLLEDKLPLSDAGILVSGRASFELMQKALMAGCPLLAAVGAPSSLAVELAQEYDITLVGFLRAEGFNIYHGEARVLA